MNRDEGQKPEARSQKQEKGRRKRGREREEVEE